MEALTTLTFETMIHASKEKVWHALWNEENYRDWTSVFSEGSTVETDWKEGSKVLFLSGSGEGMYSEIARNIPGEFMSFRHIGMVKDGKELLVDDEAKAWSGAMENYRLAEREGGILLEVEVQTTPQSGNYFNEVFPKALAKVKEIAES